MSRPMLENGQCLIGSCIFDEYPCAKSLTMILCPGWHKRVRANSTLLYLMLLFNPSSFEFSLDKEVIL